MRVFVVLVIGLISEAFSASLKPRRCEYLDGSALSPDSESSEDYNYTGTEIECNKDSRHCFALWKYSNETGKVIFMNQGCWKPSKEPPTCGSSSCSTVRERFSPDGISPNESHPFFCCCATDHCNGNVTLKIVDEDEERTNDDVMYLKQEKSEQYSYLWMLLIFSSFLVLCALAYAGYRYKWSPRKTRDGLDDEASIKLIHPSKQSNASWELEESDIVIGDDITHGKFGRICQGKIVKFKALDIVFKLYRVEEKEYFENERMIYQLINNNCNNIIKYHGWSLLPSESMVLALKQAKCGSLNSFLSSGQNINGASALCMMKDIACGLSYLHGNNMDKIVVAHRDLTSKNILIDEHKRCYLSDFGLSLMVNASNYHWNGRDKEAESCSLTEAGTLRYMAPELLGGAVNLKDCENALKQADVYALALILWEIAHASVHFSIHKEPKHLLPYESEIGKEMNAEKLTDYVVERRERPSFKDWRDNEITRSLRDTLNESWDPEPDARLTCLCLEERISDLQNSYATLSNTIESSKNLTPLSNDTPCMDSPWAGRNACLQRNLLFDNDSCEEDAAIVKSEKKNFITATSSTDGDATTNTVTTTTDLSSSASHIYTNQSNSIPLIHNAIYSD